MKYLTSIKGCVDLFLYCCQVFIGNFSHGIGDSRNLEAGGRIVSKFVRIHLDSCKVALRESLDSPPFNLFVLHLLL